MVLFEILSYWWNALSSTWCQTSSSFCLRHSCGFFGHPPPTPKSHQHLHCSWCTWHRSCLLWTPLVSCSVQWSPSWSVFPLWLTHLMGNQMPTFPPLHLLFLLCSSWSPTFSAVLLRVSTSLIFEFQRKNEFPRIFLGGWDELGD